MPQEESVNKSNNPGGVLERVFVCEGIDPSALSGQGNAEKIAAPGRVSQGRVDHRRAVSDERHTVREPRRHRHDICQTGREIGRASPAPRDHRAVCLQGEAVVPTDRYGDQRQGPPVGGCGPALDHGARRKRNSCRLSGAGMLT